MKKYERCRWKIDFLLPSSSFEFIFRCFCADLLFVSVKIYRQNQTTEWREIHLEVEFRISELFLFFFFRFPFFFSFQENRRDPISKTFQFFILLIPPFDTLSNQVRQLASIFFSHLLREKHRARWKLVSRFIAFLSLKSSVFRFLKRM